MSYYPGQIIRVPKPVELTIRNSVDLPTVEEYDEYYYDPRRMNYVKIENPHEIDRLKKELAQQKKEKEIKLKNIIGYYYKR